MKGNKNNKRCKKSNSKRNSGIRGNIHIITLFIFATVLIFAVNAIMRIKVPLRIEENIQDAINLMGFGNCHVVRLEGFELIEKESIIPYITEYDIQQYINSILEAQANREAINGRKLIQSGDLAIADYKIIYNGKQLNHLEGEPIRVGSGYYDEQLEAAMIGLEVNKEYVIQWEMPYNTYNADLIGKMLDIQITVTDIYKITTPTIKEYASYNGFGNTAEYKKHVESILIKNKTEELIYNAAENILNTLISNSTFKLDENAVVDNAVSYYYQYSSWSDIYDMSLEDYARGILEYEGDIYGLCYEESAQEIKKHLVIGKLARERDIVLTSADVDNYCDMNNINQNSISNEQLSYIKYHVVESKVLEYLIENYMLF